MFFKFYVSSVCILPISHTYQAMLHFLVAASHFSLQQTDIWVDILTEVRFDCRVLLN